ncbi:hypothetical protein C8R47DRAFT_972758, partial [Mycena vitilis]
VPGAEGVEGNETVDTEAKKAAEGDSTGLKHRIREFDRDLPRNAAALKAARRILKFYASRPRRQRSLITQLRTDHIGLNKYLHRIKAVDSPLCVRRRVPETVDHFLLTCRRYLPARHNLRREIKKPLSLRTFLGDPANTTHLMNYVTASGRFPLYVDTES